MDKWKGIKWAGYKKSPKRATLHLYMLSSLHQKIILSFCGTRAVRKDELFEPKKVMGRPLKYCKRCLLREEKLDG